SQFAATLGKVAAYRLPHSGTGFVFEWRAATYTALADTLAQRVDRGDAALGNFDARMTEYDALPAATPEAERLVKLQAAEVLISNHFPAPTPPQGAPLR